MPISELKIPALQVKQGAKRTLYSFAIDGKELPRFATVSRIRRDKRNDVLGYQRPEVLSHIGEIRNYLETEDPMIPNALVIAFDERVRFEPSTKVKTKAVSVPGTLVIPIDSSLPDNEKPGWIVDGQQRASAIRSAKIQSFPVCVIGFIASDETEQREQFILVNSTKPLPRGLIYELLPETEAKLPSLLQRRRFPAYLLGRLNHDEDSPLLGMIRTPTNSDGVVQDNSVLKMLENSLNDGVLYRFRGRDSDGRDEDAMLQVLKAFWSAIKEVFPTEWGLKPRRSRLMHGAGIVSCGFLMDAIADRYRTEGIPTKEQFVENLVPIKDVCRWTDGYWEFGPGVQRKWNEIQNTSKDIQMLSNYLLVQYKGRVWSRRVSRKGRFN